MIGDNIAPFCKKPAERKPNNDLSRIFSIQTVLVQYEKRNRARAFKRNIDSDLHKISPEFLVAKSQSIGLDHGLQ
ncbi:hypothetical protein TNCV_821961 [Trichonephila clavipes]|nr:hypothetical protein TNCV_821961 [Trichonephila clavipes]